MTFHLDYDRQSDLDDSVGYWFVQPKGAEKCRVYYSCDTKLRGWVLSHATHVPSLARVRTPYIARAPR